MAEVSEVILKLGVDSAGVFTEIDKVKAKYAEVGAAVRANKNELESLLVQEKALLKLRKEATSPNAIVQYNAKIKETQAQIAKVNEELAKNKVAAKQSQTELGKAFDTTGAISLQKQLKILKADLAAATDPKDIQRLAQEAGHVQEQIDGATHSARIFATGSKFETVSRALGDVGHKILALDFDGAAKSSQLLVKAASQITFADAIKGVKDLGTTLFNLGKALITNPLFIMAAVIAAVGFAAKQMFDTFKAGDAIFEKSVQSLKEMTKATEELIRANRDLALQNEIDAGRLDKVNGEKLKNQNKFIDEYLKLIQDSRQKEEDINKEFDEAKNTLTLKALKLFSPAAALVAEIKLAETRTASLLNIEEGFNKQKEALLKKFGITNEKILIDQANEQAKKAKELAEKRAKELEAQAIQLRNLEASNITDQFDRLRAQLTIKYNDDFKAAKGNAALILELRRELDKNIQAVNDAEVKANKDKLNRIQKQIEDANQENLDEFLKDQRDKLTAIQSDLTEEQRHQTELLTIKLEGNRNASQLLLVNEIANAEAQLAVLKSSGVAEEDEITRQNNKIIELKAKLNGELQKLDKQRLLEVLDQTQQLTDAAVSAANKVLDTYIKSLEKQTDAQQKRVDDAEKIAEDGNSQLLELEKKRLEDLNKEREKFVRAQQALAAIELVAETAVMVAKAGAEGGAAAAVTIAAAILALIAGLAQARSVAGQAAFYEGGEGYTGDGNPRDVSTRLGNKDYTYHKREYIFNNEKTSKYINHFRDIHKGKMDLNEVVHHANLYKMLSANGIDMRRDVREVSRDGSGSDIGELKSLMRETTSAIKNQDRLSVNIDENGLAIIATTYINKQKRLNNLAR